MPVTETWILFYHLHTAVTPNISMPSCAPCASHLFPGMGVVLQVLSGVASELTDDRLTITAQQPHLKLVDGLMQLRLLIPVQMHVTHLG